MGFFSNIMDKIRQAAGFGGSRDAQPKQPTPPAGGPAAASAAPQAAAPAAQPLGNVDVDAVLAEMAKKKGVQLNYRESIVDLLKLLDLDSSLNARKELAQELGVNAGPHGSAEQNIALHKAVMREFAKNGGKVPAELRD